MKCLGISIWRWSLVYPVMNGNWHSRSRTDNLSNLPDSLATWISWSIRSGIKIRCRNSKKSRQAWFSIILVKRLILLISLFYGYFLIVRKPVQKKRKIEESTISHKMLSIFIKSSKVHKSDKKHFLSWIHIVLARLPGTAPRVSASWWPPSTPAAKA